MQDKTLILGAAGFIGTNLTLRLIGQNKNLILFDRPEAVYCPEIQGAKQVQIRQGAFTQMQKEDWKKVLPDFAEVECVYHLISTTCPTNSNRDIAGELADNVIGTTHFLDACVEAGVKKVVFLSSGGTVYGKEHTGLCKEEEEAFPITVYGMQKLSIEKLLYLYYQLYNLDYRIVRLSNPYGPYQKPNGVQGAVTTFTYRILRDEPITVYGDGSVVRDYIYIADAIEGILTIAEEKGRYKLYNLGSGQGVSIRELIDTIAEVLHKTPCVRYEAGRKVDVPVNVLDIVRYEQDFGHRNNIPLREGIQKLAAFFEQN